MTESSAHDHRQKAWKRTYLLTLISSTCVFFALMYISLPQVFQDAPVLSSLRPVISLFVSNYSSLTQVPTKFYQSILTICAAFWCLGVLLSAVFRSRVLLDICLVSVTPLIAEGCVLLKDPYYGAALYFIGLLIAFLWFRGGLPYQGRKPTFDRNWKWEVALFSVLFLLIALLRFYLINRVPLHWDTEMCVDRHFFFSTADGVMRHETGEHPQTTAGALWLFIHYLLGHVDEPDFYYVYLRLMGVGISLLKVTTVFLCMRGLFGPLPAFMSSILLGFGPPEDWWSREPNFHHLPGLVAVFVFWSTANAFLKKRWRDFALLALFIALNRFVYASGIFFSFMPLTFFCFLLLLRWSDWKRHLPKLSLVAVGSAFWLLWKSLAFWIMYGQWRLLPPLNIPSHTALPVGLWERLHTIFMVHGRDVLTALFLHQVNPTHWTEVLSTTPYRSVTSIVLILGIIGLGRLLAKRRDPLGWLLLLSIGWAIFPGLTTPVADRRIGVVFVFLILFASRETGIVAEQLQKDGVVKLAKTVAIILPVVMAVYLAWMSSAKRFRIEGTPYQIIRGRLIRELMEPNALHIQLVVDHACPAFYSAYRSLKDCTMGWVQPHHAGSLGWEAIAKEPRITPSIFPYKHTDLQDCLPKYPSSWNRIVFLIVEGPGSTGFEDRLRELYPDGVVERRKYETSLGITYEVTAFKIDS